MQSLELRLGKPMLMYILQACINCLPQQTQRLDDWYRHAVPALTTLQCVYVVLGN